MSDLAQTVARLDHERRVLATQAAVLEAVARGAGLPDVLCRLCELIETEAPGALCSVLLLEEASGRLRTAAAPSLPPEYAAALDGIEPVEGAGSCGTAAARGELVLVSDVRSDPLWDSFRALASRFGIRSCWSSPIVGPGDTVLGTFAISRGEPGAPTDEQRTLLRTASHLAGIAVERERVQQTEERLALELRNQQRLESLGVLAGGIAHDLNNLMTTVMGNLGLAADAVSDAEALGHLKAAEAACESSKLLSSRFLAFAQGGAPVREPVDLDELVREAAAFALAGSSLAWQWRGSAGLPAVDADPSQLLQLVSNLLINADQASAAGDVVELGAVARELVRGERVGLAPGRYVVLSVRDHGEGIPTESIDRIFDPYFTLRSGGSGLGLATVYSIARAHGGRVEVSSRLGEGATFRVYLPATDEPARPRVRAEPQVPRAAGRVLILDDEPAVLRVAQALLERAGYEVEGAEEGGSAVALFSEAHEAGRPFDAVVLDLTVRRGLGGEATVTLMRQVDPGLAAVVASGYSSDAVLSDPGRHGFDAAVAKPFGPSDLSAAVERALRARGRLARADAPQPTGGDAD